MTHYRRCHRCLRRVRVLVVSVGRSSLTPQGGPQTESQRVHLRFQRITIVNNVLVGGVLDYRILVLSQTKRMFRRETRPESLLSTRDEENYSDPTEPQTRPQQVSGEVSGSPPVRPTRP